ncbi:hypothetical protein BCR32DRAFT_330930 [Anaeromyces robustus]|uniref:Uncharacterized protein n=1 Tax=Anaeromyces robustus TaxID=1754192 RepID=A0A1Y1VPW7_9FUNG|nr:hypothetical protein BCR32DRAFT_330930 [Anaeromyces robustus]|eukprot:ORX61831.1 hypothetical protein BCR32DRAFT_330930 [Anaeromyces robustus]
MSVEVDQKEEEIYNNTKSKRADKLREYYFPAKENNPAQQETEKIPKKRSSLVASVDPTELPQVNYTTLGIDIDQLDSTISFNVESFVNDTLGEFGWTPTHELELSQTLNLDDFKINDVGYLDNQCLELIQKAYKNDNLSCRAGKIVDLKETSDNALLEKIQHDFDSLRVITETVEAIIPKSQTMENLNTFCKQINESDKAKEYIEVFEENYVDNNPDNEAFALIAFYRLRQMELSGIQKII